MPEIKDDKVEAPAAAAVALEIEDPFAYDEPVAEVKKPETPKVPEPE